MLRPSSEKNAILLMPFSSSVPFLVKVVVQHDRTNGRGDCSAGGLGKCAWLPTVYCMSHRGISLSLSYSFMLGISFIYSLTMLYMYTLYLDHIYPNSPLSSPECLSTVYLNHSQTLPARILTDLADSILGRTCHITVAVMSL